MIQTQLMGIVNVTPDSFSDGNLYFEPAAAAQRVAELFDQGAALVDIGAESTRPQATPLSSGAEWQRLQPVLAAVLPRYGDQLSIDSRHPETIDRVARSFGPHFIINDVTGFNDPRMVVVAAKHHLRCIVSHLPAAAGSDVQAAHRGELLDDMAVVRQELLARQQQLVRAGVPAEHIILDPGIGFGKTAKLNRQLLEFPRELPEYPVLLGYSRKRFLGEQRFELAPNLAAGRLAMAAGAAYLRVHDVAAHAALLAERVGC